jgi:hypothetical protein
MTECNRTPDQARRDYAAGLIKSAVIVRVPMSAGEWMIRLQGRKGDAGMLLDVATLGPAVFRSLDRALGALEQMGLPVSQLTPG